MWSKFVTWLEENRDYGFSFWYAYDPISQQASITLFMAYVSFIMSIISLIALHFSSGLVVATGMSFLLTFVMVIFYLIRSLNKAEINIKEKTLKLESGESNDQETSK